MFLEILLINYSISEKCVVYPQFSFWISRTLAKFFFSCKKSGYPTLAKIFLSRTLIKRAIFSLWISRHLPEDNQCTDRCHPRFITVYNYAGVPPQYINYTYGGVPLLSTFPISFCYQLKIKEILFMVFHQYIHRILHACTHFGESLLYWNGGWRWGLWFSTAG